MSNISTVPLLLFSPALGTAWNSPLWHRFRRISVWPIIGLESVRRWRSVPSYLVELSSVWTTLLATMRAENGLIYMQLGVCFPTSACKASSTSPGAVVLRVQPDEQLLSAGPSKLYSEQHQFFWGTLRGRTPSMSKLPRRCLQNKYEWKWTKKNLEVR